MMSDRQGAHPSAGDPYVPDSGDDSWSADHYDLRITYRPESNRLDGQVKIDARARRATGRIALDLAGLSVDKVRVNGRNAKKHSHRGDKLLVTTADELAAEEEFTITVAYSGKPHPVRSRWGDVGWEELSEGALVAGQPNGAPSWFPCNDHPSDKATYRIGITTDTPFTALAPGLLTSRTRQSSTTTWVYEQDEPMATYLATVQIGVYAVLDRDSHDVAQVVAFPARLRENVSADFGRQDEMIGVFAELFGAYPFPSYTVVVTDDPLEIPLEAQAMSVFGSNHADGTGQHERLVAHELAHQWFGNCLTVSRWSDIWLNEGFACYAEWLWSERSGGPSSDEHAERYWKRLRRSPKDLLLADPGPDLMFDDRLYKRGALTLHALRSEVGDRPFFVMLAGWVAKFRHANVDTAAFVEHITATLGRPARELLCRWVFEAQLPPLPTIDRRR